MTLDDDTIPQLLRVTRARKRQTQAEAAAEMAVHPSTVYKWENNQRCSADILSVHSLRCIAAYCSLPIEEVERRIPTISKEEVTNETA